MRDSFGPLPLGREELIGIERDSTLAGRGKIARIESKIEGDGHTTADYLLIGNRFPA